MKITSLAYSRSEDDPKKYKKNPDAVRPAPSPLGLAALGVGGGGSSGTSITINSTNGVIPYRSAANTFTDSNLNFSANVIEQRNSTNAQIFRIYNTTDAGLTNYERATFGWISNELRIGGEKGGTGASRDVRIFAQGSLLLNSSGFTGGWVIAASGQHFLASTDNVYDIGASGATRPRIGYFGTSVRAGGSIFSDAQTGTGSTGYLYWTSRSQMTSPADGIIFLQNNAGTDFSRLQFGGTTAAFGAIGRDGAGIKFVGGDGTSVSWTKVPGVTVANLPAAATAGVGARSFVTDASAPTFGATVTGGGAVASPVYSDGSNWKVG